MIDIHKKYSPLIGFFFPSGWVAFKNDFYDVSPETIINAPGDEAFLIEEIFFSEDVFISKCEMPLTTTQSFMAMVSIGCRLFLDDGDDVEPYCIYDITIYLYKISGRKKELFFEFANQTNEREKAAKIASSYMYLISQGLYPDLKSGMVGFSDIGSDYFNVETE